MKLPPTELLRIAATPRMLATVVIVLLTVLIPATAANVVERIAPGALRERPVPYLSSTPEGHGKSTLTGLPKPGPNQRRAGDCDPDRAQVEINGGCWVKTETKPPCPEGKQWEHEGRCWLPVAPAAPVPTTGGAFPVTVADPAE